jgi:hypothetical protein
MSAINSKFHIDIGGFGFVLAVMPRGNRHIYGREEAPAFVNKFSTGDPNYRDSTFFPHCLQNNWLNGFDQEKFNDGGKFYRSSGVDTTNQEKLTLQKAMDSAGSLSYAPKSFGLRSASSANWWNTNYGYRQQLTITAPAGVSIPQYYPCKITIDTGALQTASKVRSDRNDWRVVYVNGTTITELYRDYISASVTFFAAQAAISSGQTDNNYYVYYGYSSESTSKQPSAEADWNAVYGMYGTTPDSNTKGLWHFREGSGTSVNDDSPTGKTLTLAGSQTWATDGKFGRYDTQGGNNVNDHITAASDSEFNVAAFTIEGWMKLTNRTSMDVIFYRKKQGGAAEEFAYRGYYDVSTGSRIVFQTNNGSSNDNLEAVPTVTMWDWVHLAFICDGTTKKIFCNGVQIGATQTISGVVASEGSFYLGGDDRIIDGRDNCNGSFQHWRFSNTARTSFPYVLTSEPTVSGGTETPQASASASGVYEVYAGDVQGNVYLWDGINSWSNVFNIRRLQWFDTVANVDSHQTIGDGSGTEYAQAQSFKLAAATKVKAVQVYLKKFIGTPGDITVRIETNSSSKPSGTLADSNLTATIPAFTTTDYGWITVEFTAPSGLLSAATSYWLVLKTAAAANDNYYVWGTDASSPTYSDGNMAISTDGGSTWTADAAKDAMFRILAELSQVNQMTQVTLGGSTKIWMATGDPTNTGNNNARLYTYDGSIWVLAYTFTGTGSAAALCLQVYGLTTAKLYIGLCPTAQIYVTSDGTTFTLSKDIDEPNNPGFVWDLEVYNGRLYAAGGHPEYVTNNNSQGFLWSFDDYQWTYVYDFGFTVIKSLATFDSLLFLGTIDNRLYVYNTASMDKLLEFTWDVSINWMVVHDDKLAIGLGATNSLTGEEAVYYFDRNGFHKAFSQASVGINCLFVSRNQLLIGTTGTTVYKVSTNTYQASGTLQMSYFEAGLPSMNKLWRDVTLHFESLFTGCSITIEYKTDESDASWTNVGTANTVGSLTETFTFAVAFYSKKLSLRITLATSDNTKTPTLKVIDIRYVLAPDFKYMWKFKIACPDNIVWLDGTEPISTTTAAITLAQTTLPLLSASGFPTAGRAVVVDNGVEDEFTWTGKSTNTLTGVVGLLAHTSSGLTVEITGAMLHKQILTMKQAKTFYTFTDIDGLTYTVLFHQYQADDFVINTENGIENDVPVTLLEV